MAARKPLTALVKPEMSNFNNSNTTQLAVKVPLSTIKFSEEFQKLFPLDETAVDRYAQEMKENGYDISQPIHIWQEENVLIDGHTRFASAQKAGLYDIPVFKHSFASMKEALIYAYSLQINRRNLDEVGILIAVEKLDSLKEPGRKKNGEISEKGRSSDKLGQQLGCSGRKIERARQVIKKASPEIIEAVKNHSISVNKALSTISEKNSSNSAIKKLDVLQIFQILEKNKMVSAIKIILDQYNFSESEKEILKKKLMQTTQDYLSNLELGLLDKE